MKMTFFSERELGKIFSTVIQSSTNFIFILKKSGEIRFFNPMVSTTLSYSEKELEGKQFSEILLMPQERLAFQMLLSRLVPGEKGITFPGKILDKENRRYSVEWQLQANSGESPDQELYLLIGKDVTEREAILLSLQESDYLYRVLFEASGDALAIMQENRFLDCNQNFQSLLGLEFEEIRGKDLLDLAPPQQRDGQETHSTIPPYFTQAMKGKPQDFQWVLMKKNGSLIDIESRLTRFVLESKVYLLHTFRDISQRVTALNKLKERESALFRAKTYITTIIDSIPNIFIGVNRQGLITHWNHTAESSTGIPTTQVIGKALSPLFPYINDLSTAVTQAIDSNQAQQIQKVAHPVDNHIHYEKINVFPLQDQEIDGVVIIIEDITEKIQREEIMIQTDKMLSVGSMTAGIAHEINNPLAGIMQSLSLIKSRLTDAHAANKKAAQNNGITMNILHGYLKERNILQMINLALQSAHRAATIVRDILNFSRKKNRDFSQCDIRKVLDKTLTLAAADFDLSRGYDFRKIKITKVYTKKIRPIYADVPQIQQVFLNILSNGAQAMAQDKNCTKPRFTLRVQEDDNYAQIELANNGPVLDEVTHQRLFEPFYTTKSKGKGTGLGLSLSFYIVTELHRGSIWVESTPPQGVKFIIRLPMVRTLSADEK